MDEAAGFPGTVVVDAEVPDDVRRAVRAAGFEVRDAPADAPGVVVILAGAPPTATGDGSSRPVIVVTEEPDAVDLSGSYDVLRLPASPAEVAARVRAAARYAAVLVELHDLSRTDVLTGLSNRRHLDEHLEMVASSARRLRASASLLVVDIDHFKRVNEGFGYWAGDQVLQEVARRIRGRLRGEDLVGRWGGEEFLVILPHTPMDGAWRLAERIRQAVADTPVKVSDGQEILVTLSIGCAEGDGDDVEDHLRRVEAALHEAKLSGRNRVVADPTPAL